MVDVVRLEDVQRRGGQPRQPARPAVRRGGRRRAGAAPRPRTPRPRPGSSARPAAGPARPCGPGRRPRRRSAASRTGAAAVWSVPASTAASSAVRFAPSSAYSGTRPTSPGRSGRAGAVPGTVRVCRSAADSAADDASIPSLIHTASPRLPAATMPSPEPFGSRTASRTPSGAATSFDSAEPAAAGAGQPGRGRGVGDHVDRAGGEHRAGAALAVVGQQAAAGDRGPGQVVRDPDVRLPLGDPRGGVPAVDHDRVEGDAVRPGGQRRLQRGEHRRERAGGDDLQRLVAGGLGQQRRARRAGLGRARPALGHRDRARRRPPTATRTTAAPQSSGRRIRPERCFPMTLPVIRGAPRVPHRPLRAAASHFRRWCKEEPRQYRPGAKK